jgi:hypothetical protein
MVHNSGTDCGLKHSLSSPAQRHCEPENETSVCQPSAFPAGTAAHVLWKCSGDHDGNVRLGVPLVVLQLLDPAIVPVFGVLGFPQNGAAVIPGAAVDALKNVGSANTPCHRFDGVEREVRLQELL